MLVFGDLFSLFGISCYPMARRKVEVDMGKRKIGDFLLNAFSDYKEDIKKENRTGLHILAVVGFPLSVANFACQFVVIGKQAPFSLLCTMMAYFFLLMLAESFLIPKELEHPALWLYVLETPAMILAILFGTVWDPAHQAITILLFIVTMPLLIIDTPVRLMCFSTFWAVLFSVMSFIVKSPQIASSDITHVIEFLVASLAMMNVVIWIRLNFLETTELATYRLNHDAQTDCMSRYALASGSVKYVDKPLLLLLADMDRLLLFKDFYGHSEADKMIKFFAQNMKDQFGQDRTYRYGGDELLCVMEEGDLDEGLQKIENCRRNLGQFYCNGKPQELTFALGYVTGTPTSQKEFQKMLQLADINMHKARQAGLNQTVGNAYDEELLRKQIVDSTLFIHAKGYETNRLTGLPNMSYFVAKSDEILNNIVNPDRVTVIGYFDITGLREYNSKFGYEQGDQLIADTATQLREALGSRLIGHITAAKFCMACYEDEAEAAFLKVTEAMKDYKAGTSLQFKVGFAKHTGEENTIVLLDRAKVAMDSIKNVPDRYIRYYDDELDNEMTFARYITSHVDEAIEKGWLRVFYQPLVRSVTGEVCNEEALSRWDDPRYGFLEPYRFIPLLEEHGLMYKVNLNVVRQVIADSKLRKDIGVPVVPVSVNLSRKDFETCDMVKEISDILDEEHFPRDMIKIEITESAFITNQKLLREAVVRFREAGFEVWMDDFGSEYSTLLLLQELDFDLIKIDMSFMRNFSRGSKNFIIVSDIIDMARQMGITTLIEGVENWEQYGILKRLGCEKIQGFLFNRPNSLDYIIDRAISGKGLTFEAPDSMPYYESIGRVDLDEPMTRNAVDGLQIAYEVPAGVVEIKDGEVFLLRGNDSFLQHMAGRGYLDLEQTRMILRTPFLRPPQEFVRTVTRCLDNDEWVVYVPTENGEAPYTAYFRRVTKYSYKGGVAVLVVLLPRHI